MTNLTIITAHFDNINELSFTYNSLESQTYKQWKLCIVDSYTPNLFDRLPNKILNDYRVEIIQQESGIYDAMNIGILNVNTTYFQILNSGTIYSSNISLESSMREIEDLTMKFGAMVHAYKMELINNNSTVKLRFSRFTYPFNCGHESTIYPTLKKNRIIHYHKYKVSSDCNFLLDYSDLYKVYFHKYPLVKYPKGGFSDSPHLFFQKIEGYLLLLVKTISRARIGASIYLINRIVKDIIRKILLYFI